MLHTNTMCIMLTIFKVSIEEERIYGILCFELFRWHGGHIISLDILCDLGLPCSTFNYSKSI